MADPAAQAQQAPPPASTSLDDDLTSMSHALDGLSHDTQVQRRLNEDMDAIAAQVAEREVQRLSLCAALAEGLGGVHEELAAARAALEQSQRLRSHETNLAQQAHAQAQALEARAVEAAAERERLASELEAEQARRAAAEGAGRGQIQQTQQAQAFATGARFVALGIERAAARLRNRSRHARAARVLCSYRVAPHRLKLAKVEADAQREAARADTAEQRAEAAEQRAAAAEQRAAVAEQRAATAEHAASEERARAQPAARQAREQRDTQREKLEDALRACKLATDECERVRRRNEQLERELSLLKQRLGELRAEEGGGGGGGLDEVFNSLGEMETIMEAGDPREAERRLRERAKRADARAVVSKFDETSLGR